MRRVIGKLVVALVASLIAVAPATAARRSVPAGWLGVAGIDEVTARGIALEPQLDAIAANGAESLRVPVPWRAMQPYATQADVPAERAADFELAGGVPTDFRELDTLVAAAATRGLRLLPAVLETPQWAALSPGVEGTPPRDPKTYAAFLGALARRYGSTGTFWAKHPDVPVVAVRDWQIWNEPSLVGRWSQQPFAKPYVALLKAARSALRAADPRGRIMLAGFPNFSWRSLEQVYRAGGKGAFDLAAVHPYTTLAKNVVRIVELNRNVMRKYRDLATPITLTEISWSSGKGMVTPSHGFAPLTEAGQAGRITDVLARLAAVRTRYRIAGVYWFTWLSPATGSVNSFDYAGLRRLDDRGRIVDKPALAAYRAAAAKLEGCTKASGSTRCR